jgi:N utilization substance protein B
LALDIKNMSESIQKKEKSSDVAMRRSARLMAVQAVYQHLQQGEDAPHLVAEFLAHRAGMVEDGDRMVSPDAALFKTLTFDVIQRRADLQPIVDKNRHPKETESAPAMEPLLNAILLCGAAELTFHQQTDFPIIISDYVEIAKAFYEGREAGLVNAVLDGIRKVVRD